MQNDTCIILHHTASYCIILHHTASYCIILHHPASYCIVRHCRVMQYDAGITLGCFVDLLIQLIIDWISY